MNHGVPQSRRRVFIWGVKRGYTLPLCPQPTHVCQKSSSMKINIPGFDDGITYDPIERSNGHAPHSSVTVWEAISDLPAFEYYDPNNIVPRSKEELAAEKRERERRGEICTTITIDTKTVYIGVNETKYGGQPTSEFQRMIRDGAVVLMNHITRSFNPKNIEAICRVPFYAGADHHRNEII